MAVLRNTIAGTQRITYSQQKGLQLIAIWIITLGVLIGSFHQIVIAGLICLSGGVLLNVVTRAIIKCGFCDATILNDQRRCMNHGRINYVRTPCDAQDVWIPRAIKLLIALNLLTLFLRVITVNVI